MPLYVFECDKCQHKFEVLCSMSERKKVVCKECKSKKVKQCVTMVHILGPTSSKLDNFDYAAKSRFDNAQNESRAAREEAHRRGLDGYRNIDDISSGTNFNPELW